LHGALLDAELLADMYINLTRGQDALLIDGATGQNADGTDIQIDLSVFKLDVLMANEQENAAHDDVLNQIDKASKGKTMWRTLVSNEQMLG
jgi:DNA polymerase-3 subunit epsilon